MLEGSLEALDVPFANIRGLLHGLRGASGIRRHLKFLIKSQPPKLLRSTCPSCQIWHKGESGVKLFFRYNPQFRTKN